MFIEISNSLRGESITKHPLFESLKGTVYDNYTLCVTTIEFACDGWESLLRSPNFDKFHIQLDLLLRWDCVVFLKLCQKPSTLPSCAILICGCKFQQHLSKESFYDNLL